jgi:nitrogen fixation NifU-like protein
MYSPELLEHFRNPKNTGELPPPAVSVQTLNPACGDILHLSVLWQDGRVAGAAYRIRGCTASIAAGSALTELIWGRTTAELAKLRAADIEKILGGLPAESAHAASLCIDAVRALLRASE